jgi:hypothetical protein
MQRVSEKAIASFRKRTKLNNEEWRIFSTGTGEEQARWRDKQLLRQHGQSITVPSNHYIFLNPDERLYVMHKLRYPHPRFTYVIEECTIPSSDDGLKVRGLLGLEENEACNLTAEGMTLLDAWQAQNEARLKTGSEAQRKD